MPKLYMLHEFSPFMMSFLFITDHDTAVIVDGGRPEDMPHLLECVGDRRIAAWILTHPHLDHITGFIDEVKKGVILDRVDRIYYNFPSSEFVRSCEKPDCEDGVHSVDKFTAILPLIADKAVIAEPGLSVDVDELRIDFIFCGGERYRLPRPDLGVNESSLVFKVTAPDMRSVLFLGDLGPAGGKDLLECCGEKLPSDVVQMAHHGHSGVTEAVYRRIDPKACMWCAREWLYNEPDVEFEPESYGTMRTRKWMEQLGVKEHYVTMNGTQEIPLER